MLNKLLQYSIKLLCFKYCRLLITSESSNLSQVKHLHYIMGLMFFAVESFFSGELNRSSAGVVTAFSLCAEKRKEPPLIQLNSAEIK